MSFSFLLLEDLFYLHHWPLLSASQTFCTGFYTWTSTSCSCNHGTVAKTSLKLFLLTFCSACTCTVTWFPAMIVSPYKPQWTWRSLLYISAAAAENTRDSYFWGGLPQFCSPALCVFSTLTWTCVLPHSGLPVICTVVNTLLQSAVISRSCGTQNEMTEIYYRTWEILENVQVDHCEVHGKTLTAEDKPLRAAYITGASFPHCSDGHTNRLNWGLSTLCICVCACTTVT